MSHTNIGSKHGSTFYLDLSDGFLKGYDRLQWNAVKPVSDYIKKNMANIRLSIKENNSAIQDNPYKDVTAAVRVGNKLSEGEKAFSEKRFMVVKETLEQLFNRTLTNEQVPKIAFIASGGGYRAMIGLNGSMVGAEETGLLNAVMWLVGLSGSSWYINNYMARPETPREFQTILQKNVEKKITRLSIKQARELLDALKVRFAFEQVITLIDIYGGFLIKNLLGDLPGNPNQMYLSQQAKHINQGQKPYPIYTAIESFHGSNPVWYEFTPYEVGNTQYNLYVPTWALGRKFKNGLSTDFAPEQSPGFYYGIFGSAFAARYDLIMQEITIATDELDSTSKKILELITEGIQKKFRSHKGLGKKRIKKSWGEVFL